MAMASMQLGALGAVLRARLLLLRRGRRGLSAGAAPPPPPVGEGGLYMPRYRAGMRIDVHVWVNAEHNSSAFAPTEPAFSATGLSYGAGQSRSANVTLAPDLLEVVKGNGTLWTHAVVVPAGFSPDPNDTARHNPAYTKWMSNPLVKHLKVVRGGEVKNLLDQAVAKALAKAGEGTDGERTARALAGGKVKSRGWAQLQAVAGLSRS